MCKNKPVATTRTFMRQEFRLNDIFEDRIEAKSSGRWWEPAGPYRVVPVCVEGARKWALYLGKHEKPVKQRRRP